MNNSKNTKTTSFRRSMYIFGRWLDHKESGEGARRGNIKVL
jgi:hypothetical protein